jgi:hypothetical protein
MDHTIHSTYETSCSSIPPPRNIDALEGDSINEYRYDELEF